MRVSPHAACSRTVAPFAPAGVAAVLAALSRLWTIAAELVGATASLAWTRAQKRAR